jgi:hypothetical protein
MAIVTGLGGLSVKSGIVFSPIRMSVGVVAQAGAARHTKPAMAAIPHKYMSTKHERPIIKNQ